MQRHGSLEQVHHDMKTRKVSSKQRVQRVRACHFKFPIIIGCPRSLPAIRRHLCAKNRRPHILQFWQYIFPWDLNISEVRNTWMFTHMARLDGKTQLWPHVDVCKRTTNYCCHQQRVYKVTSWGQGNCGESRDYHACAVACQRCQPPGRHHLFDQKCKSHVS